MKKVIIFLVMITMVIGFSSCELEPISDTPSSGNSGTGTDSGTSVTKPEEEKTVYVAYNVNNVWHEEVLTATFKTASVTYWNYISGGLRYWDKECTDPIIGNDTKAVNSNSGRMYWSTTLNRFVPYSQK